MHEAGAVAGALEQVIGAWPESHRGGHIEFEIRDATRAESGAVTFYASAILCDRGFDDVAVTVRSSEVWCVLCGVLATPSPANPQCDSCGAPLPRLEGPAVVAREMTESSRCA